jgi:hypothetical protein
MQEIADRIATWREHPATMVRELFKVEPDAWQEEALEAFPRNQRLAMTACKGPGKTALLAWLSWNFMLTRPHPKCAATSISGQNLADNFWAETAKWMNKSEFLKKKFSWTKTRIFANEHPETWFMSARTWPQSADKDKQAETLAGLHADYILFILDESGGIPDAVMVAAEAALSSCIEGHIVQAGNPTTLSGPLYRANTSERKLWYMIHITGDPDDPKRSPRISIQWAREMMEKWGRDHSYVLVNVFGLFPPASFNALIGADEVDAAMKRYYREHEIGTSSTILGVDVALYGDDASSIARRQGLQGFPFTTHRNVNSTQGAAIVNRIWGEVNADAVFIDATGGFGAGWLDQLHNLGRAPIGVQFAGKPHDPSAYQNKRAEMYFDMINWIRHGGALPQSRMLKEALINTTYTAPKGLLILEPKEFVKSKIGGSPDEADSLAMTFAEPVTPKARQRIIHRDTTFRPFADLDKQAEQNYGQGGYNPFQGS